MSHVSPSTSSPFPCCPCSQPVTAFTDRWCLLPPVRICICLGFPSRHNGICVPVHFKANCSPTLESSPLSGVHIPPLQCSPYLHHFSLSMSSIPLAYKHILVSSILKTKFHLTLRSLYSTKVVLVKMIKILLIAKLSCTVALTMVGHHLPLFWLPSSSLCTLST